MIKKIQHLLDRDTAKNNNFVMLDRLDISIKFICHMAILDDKSINQSIVVLPTIKQILDNQTFLLTNHHIFEG